MKDNFSGQKKTQFYDRLHDSLMKIDLNSATRREQLPIRTFFSKHQI